MMDAIDDLPVDLGTALEFRNKKHAILIEASVIVSTIKIKGKKSTLYFTFIFHQDLRA